MSNKRTENLIALKELLKDTIREDAQNMCEFEEKVNEITFEKEGIGRITATGDYIVNRVVGDMCNRIIDSRMSIDNKEYILSTIINLLDLVGTSTMLGAMSPEERQKAIEKAAEEYIKTHKDIAEKMYPTGGTTETHKTEVVE